MMNRELLRFYWMGKKPSTRKAVEAYLVKLAEGEPRTQKQLAEKYGVSTEIIRMRLRELEEKNLLRFYVDNPMSYWNLKMRQKSL